MHLHWFNSISAINIIRNSVTYSCCGLPFSRFGIWRCTSMRIKAFFISQCLFSCWAFHWLTIIKIKISCVVHFQPLAWALALPWSLWRRWRSGLVRMKFLNYFLSHWLFLRGLLSSLTCWLNLFHIVGSMLFHLLWELGLRVSSLQRWCWPFGEISLCLWALFLWLWRLTCWKLYKVCF